MIEIGVELQTMADNARARVQESAHEPRRGAYVDNSDAIPRFVAFAIRDNEKDFVAGGSQRTTLLEENPRVVSGMDRREVSDPQYGNSCDLLVPAVTPRR